MPFFRILTGNTGNKTQSENVMQKINQIRIFQNMCYDLIIILAYILQIVSPIESRNICYAHSFYGMNDYLIDCMVTSNCNAESFISITQKQFGRMSWNFVYANKKFLEIVKSYKFSGNVKCNFVNFIDR